LGPGIDPNYEATAELRQRERRVPACVARPTTAGQAWQMGQDDRPPVDAAAKHWSGLGHGIGIGRDDVAHGSSRTSGGD
jgi:hypothetical protein